ncbi:hypothetical protein K1719_019677 [Acacia pycnantha]|nr:hypothetical protein K1719_019677 [Acacia pycnantha]
MKMMPNLKSHTLKVKSNPSLKQIHLVTSTEEDDQVEKLIQWAKDAARPDPSTPSDDDDEDREQQNRDRMKRNYVIGTNISLRGYAKVGDVDTVARFFFDESFEKDKGIWGAMISGCWHLDSQMLSLNQTRMPMSIRLGTRLLDMYAKCGHLDLAKRLFESMSQRDTICYNAMISGMAMHGEGENALKLFLDMEKAKIKPDDLTFLVVFSACSHAGMAQHGLKFLDKKINVYNIDPKAEHYNCSVDFLSRSGLFEEAKVIIRRISHCSRFVCSDLSVSSNEARAFRQILGLS